MVGMSEKVIIQYRDKIIWKKKKKNVVQWRPFIARFIIANIL